MFEWKDDTISQLNRTSTAVLNMMNYNKNLKCPIIIRPYNDNRANSEHMIDT